MNMHTNSRTTSAALKPSLLLAALLSVFCINPARSDDTDIYLDILTLPPEQTRSNVVFVLDTSGSMGLPVVGSTRRQEAARYVSSTTYAGDPNYSGGAGDSDYYYLYLNPDTYADQLIYFNKVHRNQMTCDMSTLGDSTPYNLINGNPLTGGDHYIFDTGSGSSDWLNVASSSRTSAHMCAEHDASCNFTSGPTGPLVDCKSEEKLYYQQ